MNTENEMNEEVRQLLDSLEEHGKNARRQKELGDLIDRLADEEKTVAMPRKHRKLTPLWWAMGAAAACLLLWLLIKPNAKQQPEMEQKILVEETKTVDSVKTEVNDAVFEQPVANETFLAEETPVVPQNAPMKKEKTKTQIIKEVGIWPVGFRIQCNKTIFGDNVGIKSILCCRDNTECICPTSCITMCQIFYCYTFYFCFIGNAVISIHILLEYMYVVSDCRT